jgi:Siphovirus Gp157
MTQLDIAVNVYRVIRDRVRSEEQDIDDLTLANTVEGLTDLHEILAAVIRSALTDEALATGLKVRIKEMQERLSRLENRAAKRRLIARDAMLETGIKKLTAPDFTVSLRAGAPALFVIDEGLIPETYWEPQPQRLKRQDVLADLKRGNAVPGVQLSNPEPILSVRSS